MVNEIKFNSSKIIENLKIEFDDPISAIKVTDREGFIATVAFDYNPTAE